MALWVQNISRWPLWMPHTQNSCRRNATRFAQNKISERGSWRIPLLRYNTWWSFAAAFPSGPQSPTSLNTFSWDNKMHETCYQHPEAHITLWAIRDLLQHERLFRVFEVFLLIKMQQSENASDDSDHIKHWQQLRMDWKFSASHNRTRDIKMSAVIQHVLLSETTAITSDMNDRRTQDRLILIIEMRKWSTWVAHNICYCHQL